MMFLLVNLTNWSDRFYLAGVSIVTVFAILIILVLILQVFSNASKKAAQKAAAPAPSQTTPGKAAEQSGEEDIAAMAVALHLYLEERNNSESHVLTIVPTPGSAWGAQLNPRL